MSKNATDLCILLVDEVYGELTSCVFKELLYYGRLSFSGLLHHTHLTPSQLRHSLAVLVQQHLVYWNTDVEDNVTFYEANQRTSYRLVRAGKYIKFTEDRFGEFAGGVISNLLLLGHARIGDLAQAYTVARPKDKKGVLEAAAHGLQKKKASGVATTKEEENAAESQNHILDSLNLTLCDLLQAGLIFAVHESHFRTDADNRSEAEKEIPHPKAYVGKYKKELEIDWERNIQQKLEDWKHGSEVERTEIAALSRGNKRLLDDPEFNQDFKKRRLNAPLNKTGTESTVYGTESKISQIGDLDGNIVLRINHHKFSVVTRNQQLVERVERCIGTATSRVYAEILRQLEAKLLQCQESIPSHEDPDERDTNSLPQVFTHDLAALLQDSTDFANAIGHPHPNTVDLTVVDHRKKLRRKESADLDNGNKATSINPPSSDENEDDQDSDNSDTTSNPDSLPSSLSLTSPSNPSTTPPSSKDRAHFSTIRQHLLLLCEHPHCFLYHLPRTSSTSEKWAVDFPALSKTLLEITLAETLSARFGPYATRITNILAAKGKLDEKTLTALGLLNQKTMRSLVTAMHQSGYLQLQEIPRDANRQPSRTLFLWAWDPERARAQLLEECYATMERLVRRARVERERVRETIEKASRTDVVGREKEFLAEGERVALGGWRAREERIWGEVGRLDDVVSIVRDF